VLRGPYEGFQIFIAEVRRMDGRLGKRADYGDPRKKSPVVFIIFSCGTSISHQAALSSFQSGRLNVIHNKSHGERDFQVCPLHGIDILLIHRAIVISIL